MRLNDELIALLKQEGCSIVGFADITCLPEEARLSFDRGILIALPFTREAMLENKNGLPRRYLAEHEPMTRQLQYLKKITVNFLKARGYEATGDTPASVIDYDALRSPLPQKTVATLAGVGWIGKNAMLVTEEAGSAVRVTVVLTDAPLDCGTPVTKSKCAPGCTACADICPGKAPLGGLWEAGLDRDSFFDAHACQAAARARARKRGEELLYCGEAMCGLCVSNCPFTKRGLKYS